MLSILQQIHISSASAFFFIVACVYGSMPYRRNKNTQHCRIDILNPNFIFFICSPSFPSILFWDNNSNADSNKFQVLFCLWICSHFGSLNVYIGLLAIYRLSWTWFSWPAFLDCFHCLFHWCYWVTIEDHQHPASNSIAFTYWMLLIPSWFDIDTDPDIWMILYVYLKYKAKSGGNSIPHY